MNKKIIEEFKSILMPAEFYTDKVYTELSLSKEESMTILKYINNLEEQNNKYKNALDKIKEIINYYAIENEDYSKIYNQEEQEIMKLLEEIK